MMPDPTIIAFPQDGRPVPPVYLSAAEAETWRAVVGAGEAGYFGPEVFPLLEAYCATALACDHIAARLGLRKVSITRCLKPMTG
jgi:hypothetical protein